MAATVSTMPAGDEAERLPQDVISALSTSPHVFLQPTSALHTAAINAAKQFLDPLASTVSDAQALRRQENRRKRKRSTYDDEEEQVLQLRQVYTDGFDISQIWEQAKRILDAAQGEVSKGLQEVQRLKDGTPQSLSRKSVHFEDDGDLKMRVDESEDLDDDEVLPEDVDDMPSDEEVLDEYPEDEDMEDGDLVNEGLDDEDIELSDEDDEPTRKEPDTFVQDPNGLNDGFFSIDDFNRQSQFLEQQDERGDDDGAASDEEDVDWDADPLEGGLQPFGKSTDGDDAEEDGDDDDDEAGPTLGNADLNAPSDDEDEMDEDEGPEGGITIGSGLENTNDILYKDFFDPPAKKPSKTKRMRALPKTQPPKATQSSDDLEADMQRAVSDVRRDLFDDDASASESSDPDAPGTSNLSTHERQRLKLMSEIRRLESAAVAKRDWTLSGEARATDRPINSLIEEDLEFERTGKPVPVITNEVTEEIEALIKRRILAREFDEVTRRRPELSTSSSATRRGLTEIDDTKPQESLSSIYETEHLKSLNPQAYTDKASQRLQREHADILNQWRTISAQLDLLSNWNYKPKIPEASITTLTDAPTIAMEDARPAGIGGAESGLAPQEIYAPGTESGKGEVLLKSGTAVAKDEMSREEKLRRRRREKERGKKNKASSAAAAAARTGAGVEGRKGKAGKGEEKKNILEDLKRGGVKVIGKKGEVTDVQGKKAKESGLVSSASAFKL